MYATLLSTLPALIYALKLKEFLFDIHIQQLQPSGGKRQPVYLQYY